MLTDKMLKTFSTILKNTNNETNEERKKCKKKGPFIAERPIHWKIVTIRYNILTLIYGSNT